MSKRAQAREKSAERQKRQAAIMEQRFLKKERARENRLKREAASREFQLRKAIKKERREHLNNVKAQRENAPHELCKALEPLVESARRRMLGLRSDLAKAQALADGADPESVQALQAAETLAKASEREYHSLRRSLLYRRKQVEAFIAESEAKRRELWAELT